MANQVVVMVLPAKHVVRSLFKKLLLALSVLFVLPICISAVWWWSLDRPENWSVARWDATGILPSIDVVSPSAIYVMAARTGGMKGAVSMHTWLVTKPANASHYNRYDKVGWGQPVRLNAYAADARWYSNVPTIVASVHGARAEHLMPRVSRAIDSYPYTDYGDYRIWPGPNSNSFVAHVLREVPELDAVLPPLALGRDYLQRGPTVYLAPDYRDLKLSLGGWLGVSVGVRSGVELQILGLVAGLDIRRPAVKLPGLGRIGF